MFRRRIAAADEAFDIFGVAEVEYLFAGTMFENEAFRRSFDTGVDRQRTTQNRRDIRGSGQACGNGNAPERLRPALGQAPLGLVDFGDHILVGFARILRPGEDAVLQQDHAVAFRISLEGSVASLCQIEARHHIGNDDRIGE